MRIITGHVNNLRPRLVFPDPYIYKLNPPPSSLNLLINIVIYIIYNHNNTKIQYNTEYNTVSPHTSLSLPRYFLPSCLLPGCKGLIWKFSLVFTISLLISVAIPSNSPSSPGFRALSGTTHPLKSSLTSPLVSPLEGTSGACPPCATLLSTSSNLPIICFLSSCTLSITNACAYPTPLGTWALFLRAGEHCPCSWPFCPQL